MKSKLKIILVGFVILIMVFNNTISNGQNKKLKSDSESISWQFDLIDKVIITEPESIKFLLEQFFIVAENVTQLVIYDVTGNGFGEKDIAVTYPDGTIYFLEFINKEAQQIMQKWTPPANYETGADNVDPSEFESERTAEGGVLASLLWGIQRNVRKTDVIIWFYQKENGEFKFKMSGYNKKELNYTPTWPERIPDSLRLNHPVYGDTTFPMRAPKDFDILRQYVENAFAELNTDVLKIYITQTDTLYIERETDLKASTDDKN